MKIEILIHIQHLKMSHDHYLLYPSKYNLLRPQPLGYDGLFLIQLISKDMYHLYSNNLTMTNDY